MRLYLAGPLFTAQERRWNQHLAANVRRWGVEAFLPQEGEPGDLEGRALVDAVYGHDVRGLEWCDGVLANLDGPMVDDGTAWECGWAVARDKPVFGYRTDFRGGEVEGAPVNIMLAGSCVEIVTPLSLSHGPEDTILAIKDMLRRQGCL